MIIRHREDCEFQTLDGLMLRGWLFPAAQRGPAVILTPGVSSCRAGLDSSTDLVTVQLRQRDALARGCRCLPSRWFHCSGL